MGKWSNLIFFRGAVQPPPSYATKHPQEKTNRAAIVASCRSSNITTTHRLRYWSCRVWLEGRSRMPNRLGWLVGWCENWFRFFTHIYIHILYLHPTNFWGRSWDLPLHPGLPHTLITTRDGSGNPTASPGPPPPGVVACRAEPGLAAAASQAHGKLFGTTLKCLGWGLAAEIKNHEKWVENSSQLQGGVMVC